MAASTFVWLSLLASTTLAGHHKYRSSPPRTLYDQKQSGDYNIKVDLKDFQIIALLGDGDLGLGDYDYSYDYDDFTIKPGHSSTTTSTTTRLPSSSTNLPSSTPFPPLISQKPSLSSSEEPVLNIKPHESPSSTHQPILDPINLSLDENSTLTQLDNLQKNLTGVLLSAFNFKKEPIAQEVNEPGRIKVQILEGPMPVAVEEPASSAASSVAAAAPAAPLEGEVNHVEGVQKRCLNGFTKDKRGRCRRVRRPPGGQLPFGFGRLASNLVSRFRNAENAAAVTE